MNAHQRALQIVREVGEINLVGNIIPHSWYFHLKRPNGQPYLLAIVILGELVYWYRPIVLKDEATGQALPPRKKFSGPKYRTKYGDIAKQFGVSRDQAKDAITFLVNQGVLTREIKDSVRINGVPTGNVLYLEPIPEGLRRINQLPEDDALPDPSGTLDPEGHADEGSTLPLFGYGPQPEALDGDADGMPGAPLGSVYPKGGNENTPDHHHPSGARVPKPQGARTLSLRDSSPQALEISDPDPQGAQTLSLKGTKTPAEIPLETPAETPPQSGDRAAAEAQADRETLQLLRDEGLIAIEKYAQHPVWLIRAACEDTGLPRGHPQRPPFAAKRLDRYPGQWQPRRQPGAPPITSTRPADTGVGIWAHVLDELRAQVEPNDFITWLEPTVLLALDDAGAVVGAINVFAQQALRDRFTDPIAAALEHTLGRAVTVQIEIGADP